MARGKERVREGRCLGTDREKAGSCAEQEECGGPRQGSAGGHLVGH